jgi:hypothetical protein
VVDVAPPDTGDEAMWVILTAGFVVLLVIYTIAFERQATMNAAAVRAGSEGLPYQVLFRDLPSPEQRVFRELQEAAIEVLARAKNGQWPSIAQLASEDIPPFAPDPLDEARFAWQLREGGLVHQYVGVPTVAGKLPSFMLMIVEPDPQTGERPAAGVVDEEHQLTADGRLLHVTYWKRMTGTMPSEPILDPALAGWSQIRVRSLFEELKSS